MSWIATAVIGSAVIGVGTSIYGAKQANKAAKTSSNATVQAAEINLEGQKLSIEAQEKALERQIELNKPFYDLGVKNIGLLQKETRAGAPTFDEFVGSKEARAIRDQELADIAQATERTASARGNVFSPRTQLEIQDKALQKTAASKLGQYDTALARRNADLSRLTNLVNIGRGASTEAVGAVGSSGANISNIISSTASKVGNLTQDAGDARASGYAQAANVIGNNLNQTAGNLVLASLLK